MLLQVKQIFKRILLAFATIFLLVSITFFLMHLLPGDPFSGQKAIPETTKAALFEKYGLDKPLLTQYVIYIGNLFKGDLGFSLISQRPVTDIIAQAFPASLELGLRALVIALVLGLFLGIVAALFSGTIWDTATMLLALLGVSIPSFIVGSLLQYFFGLYLYQATGVMLFPVMGWNTESSKFLPSFALAFGSLAIISRLMRASMQNVLQQDYIRTAQAKGLTPFEIVFRHCLRNAITPVLSMMGPLTAVLLTGTFVVENIFSIPGLGRYFVDSVRTYDYTVIAGTTLFFGSFLVFANMLVDIIQCLVDPMIRQK